MREFVAIQDKTTFYRQTEDCSFKSLQALLCTVGSFGHNIHIFQFSLIIFLPPVNSTSVKRENTALRSASLWVSEAEYL